MFLVFPQETSCRAALDPDYGLFIGYQMPADKHKDLNACLRLLHKNLNNFAELSFRFAHRINHRSNTEYYKSSLHPASCLHYQRLAFTFEIACPEQFELYLDTFKRIKDNWTQPTGRSLTDQ